MPLDAHMYRILQISVNTHNAFRRTYVQNATNMMKMISFHTYRDGWISNSLKKINQNTGLNK